MSQGHGAPASKSTAQGADYADSQNVKDLAEPLIVIVTWQVTRGALGKVALELANGFARRGARVEVLTTSGRTHPPLLPLDASVAIRSLGVKRARWILLPLTRYLRKHRPGVVISIGWLLNLSALVAARVAGGVPVIATEHGLLSQELHADGRRMWLGVALSRLARELYPRAAGVVAVSQAVLRDVTERANVELRVGRSAVIRNPLDLARIRRLASEQDIPKWLGKCERPWYVNVARLAPEKNHALLVEAFARARRRLGRGTLLILGEGSERGRIEGAARSLGVADMVHLLGHQSNPFPYVAAADAFVLTSTREGCPLALLEAMALGTPVICGASQGGVKEVLGEAPAGMWVDPATPNHLADHMIAIARERHLAVALGKRARDRASEHDVDTVVDEWLTFLRTRGVLR